MLYVLETMLFGGKSKSDGRGKSDAVSSAYRHWQEKLYSAVRVNMPPGCGYTMLDAESLVGLMTVIFVKSSIKDTLGDVAVTTIKRYANSSRFRYNADLYPRTEG